MEKLRRWIGDGALSKFQDVINHEVIDRQHVYARQLAAKRAELAASGALHSSRGIIAFRDIASGEVRAGAQVILSQLLRCLAAYGVELNGEHLQRAKSALADQIILHSTVLRSHLLSQPPLNVPSSGASRDKVELEFNQEVNRVVDRMKHEADLAAAASRTGSATTAPTINFHGSVGIVQTGDGNSANVVQYVSSETGGQVAALLRELLDRLESAEVGPNALPLKELVQETILETEKPQPNPLKLTSSLRTIAETVKVVGSLETIYTGLKPILAGMGIHLP